jgi:hypothetical protein
MVAESSKSTAMHSFEAHACEQAPVKYAHHSCHMNDEPNPDTKTQFASHMKNPDEQGIIS